MDTNGILAELRAERDRIDRAISALGKSKLYRTTESRSFAGSGRYSPQARPHERRCAEENVAADEAALGAGKDETSQSIEAGAPDEPSCTEEDRGGATSPVGKTESATEECA
jgi:hypothetical protein